MKGKVYKPKGRKSYVYIVDVGLQPALRCAPCGKRYWETSYSLKTCPRCGQELTRSVERRQEWKGGFKLKSEAQEALNQVLAQLGSGSYIPPVNMAYRDFLQEHWFPSLENRNLRATTIETYRNYAKYLGRLGPVKIQAITPMMLNALYKELASSGRLHGPGGLSTKSIGHCHRLIHKSLSDAVKWGLVTRNVADLADIPQLNRPRKQYWGPAELRTFLKGIQDHDFHAAFFLLCTCGLRRSELLGLAWDSVDLEKGRIVISQTCVVVKGKPTLVHATKTDKGTRTLNLDPASIQVLKAHKAKQNQHRLIAGEGFQDQGLVFCRVDGSPVDPTWFTRTVKRLSAELGLLATTPHPIRHSYATAALMSRQVDVKVLADRLGHSSTAITQDLYQGYLPAADQVAADAIAKVILEG